MQPAPTDLSQFHDVFFSEAIEHLEAMETLLLAVDVSNPEPDDLNAIFRAAHSIKGGAGTFGFTNLTQITHVLESLLDRIRNRELALRPEMIDVFLEANDVLRAQILEYRDDVDFDPALATAVMEHLNAFSMASNEAPPAGSVTEQQEELASFRVTLNVSEAADETALNLCNELGTRGSASMAHTALEDGRHQYVFTLHGHYNEAGIRDIFEFVARQEDVHVVPGETAPHAAAPTTEDDGFGFFDDAPGTENLLGSNDDPGYGFFAPLPQRTDNGAAKAAPARNHEKSTTGDTSIRVSVEKVDQMINLVGELVITQAMLAQTAAQLDPVVHERLMNGMAQLERNTRDLQESVMSVRMTPMSFVFNRFPRVVRDLANKLGKEVVLSTEGEGTELDKGLIEKIVDPLTHLVRNSLDHGIETPEKRLAAGKARAGKIKLRASHRGGNILIEIEDDGAGLDRERILAKARERELAVTDTMSDAEVWQLIFAPGFSTAETVTDVSGRGVGMDVVKRNIDALGGRVEVSSERGSGTRIAIQLPLTLAILDGMSVAVGSEVFIIPLAYIAESMQPAADDLRTVSGKGQLVHVRGEYLPLVSLYRLFNLAPTTSDPSRGILVVIECGAGQVALFVDQLVGQHQVVIKSLEANYRKVPGIAGATIMGDGRVALILDVAAIARMAHP